MSAPPADLSTCADEPIRVPGAIQPHGRLVAVNAATGVEQTVAADVAARRLEKCLSCPYLMKATKQCGQCLCFVHAKTKFKQESCPDGRWQKEE